MRDDGTFDPLLGRGGPVARMHSVTELGGTCDLAPGIPAQAKAVSQRNAPTLRGNGLLDTIALGDVLANMASEPPAVRGRPNVLADGRMGSSAGRPTSPRWSNSWALRSATKWD